MHLVQTTTFKIVRTDTNHVADSASTDQWLTEERALTEARKIRDRLNEKAGSQLYKLVRAYKKRIVKPL